MACVAGSTNGGVNGGGIGGGVNGNNNANIICRVSTKNQNNESLDTQLDKCMAYLKNRNLVNETVFKWIRRAKYAPIAKTMVNSTATHFILKDVTRLCREVKYWHDTLKPIVLNKNLVLHFARYELVITSHDIINDTSNYKLFLEHLFYSEKESITTSIRIKEYREHRISQGIYAGGILPYGLDLIQDIKFDQENSIVTKYYCIDTEAIWIIRIIDLLKQRHGHFSIDTLNLYINRGLGKIHHQPMLSINGETEDGLYVTESSNRDIMSLLLGYKLIDKRLNLAKIKSEQDLMKFLSTKAQELFTKWEEDDNNRWKDIVVNHSNGNNFVYETNDESDTETINSAYIAPYYVNKGVRLSREPSTRKRSRVNYNDDQSEISINYNIYGTDLKRTRSIDGSEIMQSSDIVSEKPKKSFINNIFGNMNELIRKIRSIKL